MKNDSKLFTSKVNDMIRMASAGRTASSAFLTPEECAIAKRHILSCHPTSKYAFYGGYPEAERKILVLFSDYAGSDAFDTSDVFLALLIKTAGDSKLTHSACLGALMNCSIERSALGDIVITEEGAVVFVIKPVAELLLTQKDTLTRVGRDKVSVLAATSDILAGIRREYEETAFVMSSCRVDCLVGEITGLSREKAKVLIAQGKVMKNHEEIVDPSDRFSVDDIISVRGSGKFVIKELGLTRKGRLKVSALKYK